MTAALPHVWHEYFVLFSGACYVLAMSFYHNLQSQHRHVLDILFVRDLQHAPVSFSCCFAVWLILHAPAMPSGFSSTGKPVCIKAGFPMFDLRYFKNCDLLVRAGTARLAIVYDPV